jgi:hypothetical protein
MRLYHVPFSYGMRPEHFGEDAAVLSDQKLRMDTLLCQHETNQYIGRVQIRPNPSADRSDRLYYTDDDLTVATRVYTAASLRGVLRLFIAYDAPTDTEVGVRLTDGTDEYVWGGVTWDVAAAGEWSTPAEAVANATSWTLKALGLVFRLYSTTGESTPTVYGADAHFSLEFGRRSTNEIFPSAWVDDAVTRTFLRGLRDAVEMWTTVEIAAKATATETLDFSAGVGERPFNVRDVAAVYAVDDDADLEAPIPGSWDLPTQIWTFDDEVDAGTRLLVRMQIRPETAYMGDSDYAYTHLPLFGIEGLESADSRYRSDRHRVGGNAAAVYVLDPPKELDLVLDLVVMAKTHGEVGIAVDAMQEWIGRGRHLVSQATGYGFGVKRQVEEYSITGRGKYFVASIPVLLQGVVTFLRASEEVVTVQSISATVTENDLNVGR